MSYTESEQKFKDSIVQLFRDVLDADIIDDILAEVADNFEPEDIFFYEELEDWARNNGFYHEDDEPEDE